MKTFFACATLKRVWSCWFVGVEQTPENIPDIQKCVAFRKSQKGLNHSTLLYKVQPHRGTLTIFPRFFLLSTILPWLFFTHKKLFCTSLSFRWLFCAHLWNSRAGKLRAVSHSAESHLYLRKICLKTVWIEEFIYGKPCQGPQNLAI